MIYRSAILETENIFLNCVADETDTDIIKVTVSNASSTSNDDQYRFSIAKKSFLNSNDKIFETFDNDKVNRLATLIRQNMSNFNCQKKPIVAPSSSTTENSSSRDDHGNLPFSKFIPTPAQPRSILEDDPNRLIYPPIGRGDLGKSCLFLYSH